MKNTAATLTEQLRSIEKQATAGFMHYAPTRIVVCPHCGGRMEAMDAKAHVRTAAAIVRSER